jgi:hypothetical protein
VPQLEAPRECAAAISQWLATTGLDPAEPATRPAG